MSGKQHDMLVWPSGTSHDVKYCVSYRYPVDNGLCNQMESHINAIALSAATSAHAMLLPASRTRDSFAKSYKNTTFTCLNSSNIFNIAATRKALSGVQR